MKKTFSKKRNQRRTIYIVSALVIVGLVFGLWVSRVQALQQKAQYDQQVHQIQTDKIEKIQSLSKALETIKKQKAVTDTQLKKKAASEAQKQSEIDNLKADLQAKTEQQQTVAAAPTTGGMGGNAGDTSGNGYDYGYCTWYVKNRRPDIPNNWGDASAWLYAAQSINWPTGSAPKVGAVAQQGGGYGHVAYVEQVNGDGTIVISEMNYEGWNVESSRTADAGSFNYIY